MDYGSREMTMEVDEVVLSTDPHIMGTVVYRIGFQVKGTSENFEVEITDVDVEDIKKPVYDDDGSPVMVIPESDKQRFRQTAYDYFWNRMMDKAEEQAIDRVQMGQA